MKRYDDIVDITLDDSAAATKLGFDPNRAIYLYNLVAEGNTFEEFCSNAVFHAGQQINTQSWDYDEGFVQLEDFGGGGYDQVYEYLERCWNQWAQVVDTQESGCECGSDAVGSPRHSGWCPMNEGESL